MENTNELRTIPERGWRTGFATLFHEANASWWHSKKWLLQSVLWLLFLNGILATILWSVPAEVLAATGAPLGSITTMEAVQQNPTVIALVYFLIFSALALPVAAIIAGQDAIIGERQSGTAAWILSKPVSRPAFILSKLAASTLGMLVTAVVVQGVAAYVQLSLRTGSPWPMAGFWAAMGLLFLNCWFYLTLTYMLGSIFTNRGRVLGISLAMALIGPAFLRSLPVIKDFTPWAFFANISEDVPVGIALALGQPPASVTPIICTALMCLIFTAVAILHFQREEF